MNPDVERVSEIRNRIESRVGLEGVKTEVDDLMAAALTEMLREEEGLPVNKSTMHLVFTGAPGTGKTTMAREIGSLYHALGLIEKDPENGGYVEVTRGDLIAGYQGQTAEKVRKKLQEGKGGVIFIDEAYSMQGDSYSEEAAVELLKFAEDNRDNTVIILAGYTEPMDELLASNEGLRRRFPRTIEFASYTVPERTQIAGDMLGERQYRLSDKRNSVRALRKAVEETGEGNGGDVRNLVEYIERAHRRRIWGVANAEGRQPTSRELQLIVPEDIETGAALFKQGAKPKNPIGPVKRGRKR